MLPVLCSHMVPHMVPHMVQRTFESLNFLLANRASSGTARDRSSSGTRIATKESGHFGFATDNAHVCGDIYIDGRR